MINIIRCNTKYKNKVVTKHILKGKVNVYLKYYFIIIFYLLKYHYKLISYQKTPL